ncbi:MAG: hypothetical protein QM784_13805 [Polyangiaceae bacterium]
MAEHFANAAARHLQDSKLLLDKSRWDGSAYLAGYVIECSLKALISTPSSPPGVDLKELGHSLSLLQQRLDQMAASRKPGWKRNVPREFLSNLRSSLNSMPLPWEPAMRYAPDCGRWCQEAGRFWCLANRCFSACAKKLVTSEVTQ